MARTIRNKLDGIVSFWTFRHISNAKMEGFNNKIRWLIKQAYGFRDREYFKLKIYQLPEISSVKELEVVSRTVDEAFFYQDKKMAPAAGFEPATKWLTATYSTAELCRSVSIVP